MTLQELDENEDSVDEEEERLFEEYRSELCPFDIVMSLLSNLLFRDTHLNVSHVLFSLINQCRF